MPWEVEYTQEMERWWNDLTDAEQRSVDTAVGLLAQRGPSLPRPHVDTLKGSRHPNMKELRVQHKGEPLRVFFAFDPRRHAILLIGGNKRGDTRFYETMIPWADRLYDDHLEELRKEGLIP